MCVYNKKNMCIYMCVWGCLDKYISVATWPPQTKIPGSAPVHGAMALYYLYAEKARLRKIIMSVQLIQGCRLRCQKN